MATGPSQMPSFSRGSAVLEYWLVHAEGLVVQPLGARVEHVVVAVPAGRADALIVRSRLMHRRKTIPAAAISAVEPSSGRLLLDAQHETGALRALRLTRAGIAAVLAWLRPRVVVCAAAVASYTRLAATWTVQGIEWLAPRIEHGLARLGQQTKRTAILAAENARASLEARRAQRARRSDGSRSVELPRPRPRR